tara:strand:+ start:71 stop:439 length:369 start_codon:yes stop_codon:yes gene_type:complete
MSTSVLLSEEKSESGDAVPCCCDAVCLCLSSKPTLYRIQVADHLFPNTANGVERYATTAAAITRTLRATTRGQVMITVAGPDGLDAAASAMGLTAANSKGFTLTGSTALESGERVLHRTALL